MLTISCSIFKGGTGKTTTAVNTAAALVQKGKRVLLVDLDQQASATRYLNLDPEQSPNLYEVFMETTPAALAVRATTFGIDVLASHMLLAAIEEALEPGDEGRLTGIITPLKPQYDFIMVDTPPGKAMMAANGLHAADLILIPASAERMAIDGVGDLVSHVQNTIWSEFGLAHQEMRILFTMYRRATAHAPAVVANAKKIWRGNVLPTTIPHSIEFAKSYDQRVPIGQLNPKHEGALAYGRLADWLIEYEKTEK